MSPAENRRALSFELKTVTRYARDNDPVVRTSGFRRERERITFCYLFGFYAK